MRTGGYYRSHPRVNNGGAECVAFDDAQLKAARIPRGHDGLITVCEALRMVNEWNHRAVMNGVYWRYYV